MHEHRVTLDSGHRLHVEEVARGTGSAPAVVLLHGFAASSTTWRPLDAALTRTGRRVLAVDRIGFGRSDRPRRPREGWGPAGSPYLPSRSGSHTLQVLDALDEHEVVLIGHSAGAVTAVLVALEAPTRVVALGLLAPALLAEGPPPWVAAGLSLPGVGAVAPWALRQSSRALPRVLRRAWHDPAALDPATLDRYRAPFRTQGWEHALVEMTRASERLDLRARLGQVRAPAAVIVGSSDRIVRPRHGRRIQELLGGPTTYSEVPAAGHLLHEEQPAAVMEALTPVL